MSHCHTKSFSIYFNKISTETWQGNKRRKNSSLNFDWLIHQRIRNQITIEFSSYFVERKGRNRNHLIDLYEELFDFNMK